MQSQASPLKLTQEGSRLPNAVPGFPLEINTRMDERCKTQHGARAASMQSPCADEWMDAKHGARAAQCSPRDVAACRAVFAKHTGPGAHGDG